MSETQQTGDDVFDSLTGFDELAIAQHFGRTVGELATKDQSMFGRALVFVVKRREGLNDDDARNFALELRMKDYLGFFADPDAEPAEESGKDEQPEPRPESSPSSVSSPDEAEPSTSS